MLNRQNLLLLTKLIHSIMTKRIFTHPMPAIAAMGLSPTPRRPNQTHPSRTRHSIPERGRIIYLQFNN